jgi:hypothetical protein
MDYIPQVNRADVLRIIARDYPPNERDQALAILGQYSGDTDAGTARSHLAILKLAVGEIGKLAAEVTIATKDFRDVITPAEYPEFSQISFTGIKSLSDTQRETLKSRDWNQYRAWLTR